MMCFTLLFIKYLGYGGVHEVALQDREGEKEGERGKTHEKNAVAKSNAPR